MYGFLDEKMHSSANGFWVGIGGFADVLRAGELRPRGLVGLRLTKPQSVPLFKAYFYAQTEKSTYYWENLPSPNSQVAIPHEY